MWARAGAEGIGGKAHVIILYVYPFSKQFWGIQGILRQFSCQPRKRHFFTLPLCAQCIRLDPAAAAEGCSGLYRGVLGLGHEPAAGIEVVLWEWDFVPIFLLPQAVPGWYDKILHSSPVDGGQLG